MSLSDITKKVNKDDIDGAKLDRDSELNPPKFQPGMSDFNWDDEDDADGEGEGLNNEWGASIEGRSQGQGVLRTRLTPMRGAWHSQEMGRFPMQRQGVWPPQEMGRNPRNPFVNPMNRQGEHGVRGEYVGHQKPTEPVRDADEVFWGALLIAVKSTFSFLSDLIKSLTKDKQEPFMFVKVGRTSIFVSAFVCLLGFILMVLGNSHGLQIMLGSLLSFAFAVPIFMFAYSRQQENEISKSSAISDPLDDKGNRDYPDEISNILDEDEYTYEDEDEYAYEDEDEYAYEDEDEDDTAFMVDHFASTEGKGVTEDLMDTIIEGVSVDKGMVSRQYLVETIFKGLDYITPQFDKVTMISEGSDEFAAWDSIVRRSSELFKTNQAVDTPYLISAKDKLFYVLLEVKRVKWLKSVDKYVEEVESICRYDAETGKFDEGVYGVSQVVGDRIYIKMMKGKTAMVSLKDTYKKVGEYLLDTANFMPVVLGLDIEGEVVWRDFKDIESILITGMPRSGKSWFVLSILSQFTFYLKPSELHFYLMDPKGMISDFKTFTVPHVRKFVSEDHKILSELRELVRVEGARRKKILGDNGCVNIWDFKKLHPDKQMPLVYVIIDEVMTLAERMDKDTKAEFQGLLSELVSQLPALGIRVFMIPHMVKDKILKKTITDLIPCRASVRGDKMHIEDSVGVKNFPYKLIHQGDIALRFHNDAANFVHSAVLTGSSITHPRFLTFLTKFWLKVEPDSYEGSVYASTKTKVGSKVITEAPTSSNGSTHSQPSAEAPDILDNLLEDLHADISGDEDLNLFT